MDKQPAVYILASKRNGTLYVGVTSDLVKRIWEHKNNVTDGFTKKYCVHMLVHYPTRTPLNTCVTPKALCYGRNKNSWPKFKIP